MSDRVALFCADLRELRVAAGAAGLAGELAAVETAARAGEDVGPAVGLLRGRLGLPDGGPTRGTGAVPSLPGQDPGAPVVVVHRCPLGVCDRRWVRRPGVQPPRCWLGDRPLT